jgi:hypothetical protein
MSWRITWNPDYKTRSGIEGRHEIRSTDGSIMKGDIVKQTWPTGRVRYTVQLLMVAELTCRFETLDMAVGYVRGIEAAVKVYAKETGLVA